jgi:hypothetical protein
MSTKIQIKKIETLNQCVKGDAFTITPISTILLLPTSGWKANRFPSWAGWLSLYLANGLSGEYIMAKNPVETTN